MGRCRIQVQVQVQVLSLNALRSSRGLLNLNHRSILGRARSLPHTLAVKAVVMVMVTTMTASRLGVRLRLRIDGWIHNAPGSWRGRSRRRCVVF